MPTGSTGSKKRVSNKDHHKSKLVCLILSDHGKKQGFVDRTNLQKVNLRDPFRPWPKGGMYSSPEIHGFSPVGSQYGNFCPVHRDFPRNLKKNGDATHFRHGENEACAANSNSTWFAPIFTRL